MARQARAQDRGRPRARRQPPALPRKVRVGDATWTYKIGRDFVTIRSPDRSRSFRAWLSTVAGLTPDELKRCNWKRSWSGIGPAAIKQFIEEQVVPPEQTVVVDGVSWTYRISSEVVVVRAPKEYANIPARTIRIPIIRLGELGVPSDQDGILAWLSDPERKLWVVSELHVRRYIEENLLPPLSDESRGRAREVLVDVELAVHAMVLAYPSLNETRLDVLGHWFCTLGSGVQWSDRGVLDVGEHDDRIFRAALRVASGERAEIVSRPAGGWYPMSEEFANLLHVPDDALPQWIAAARETALAILDTPAPKGSEGDRDVRDHRHNVKLAKLALQRMSRFDEPQRTTT